MKIIIAIDKFKGSLTTFEANQATEEGIREATASDTEIHTIPIADGGDGLSAILTQCTHGETIHAKVQDPLGRTIQAAYGISGIDPKTAFIEMAEASGLHLLSEKERNPLQTSTFGTGQLILDALKRGCTHIVIGLGGSATNDAGIGMLSALGIHFQDAQKNILPPTGASLTQIQEIDRTDMTPLLHNVRFTVACDVQNPLWGMNGAAYIYAPQKGADKEMIKKLDEGLRSFANVTLRFTGKSYDMEKGSGAAGGMGFAFLAYLNHYAGMHSELKPGIDIVLQTQAFDQLLQGADWVITGEGKADKQSLMGKAVGGILRRAKERHIPTLLFAGSVEDAEELNKAGFTGVFSVVPGPCDLQEAMRSSQAYKNLKSLSCQVFRTILARKG